MVPPKGRGKLWGMKTDALPELLAPAGSFDAALAAFAYGADAVYLGLSRFSARADAANFSEAELRQIVAYAHNKGRKVYVTLNTLLETRELPELAGPLAVLDEVGADGLIVQDLGLAAWVRRAFPRLPLHASTQLACTSLAGARALKALGFVRIVTARELALAEAAEIGRRAGVEIEVFVHGALCYSISGLCLYSSLTTGRSGNRGRCAYCCRQPFAPEGAEACHPFSMRDLALLDLAPRLRASGLASLKIEGRMKNPLYVAAVTDLYRHALDGDLPPEALRAKADALRTIFSRPWTHLHADGPAAPEAVIDARSVGHRGLPIGRVLRVVRDVDGTRWMAFDAQRAIERHDGLQIDLPGRPVGFAVERLRDARAKRPAVTLPAGTRVEVALPREVGDLPRGAEVCHAASQAVRRAFPVPRPRAAELRAPRPADLTLTLAPDALTLAGNGAEARVPAALGPAKNPAGTQAAAERHLARLGEDGFFLRALTVRDPQGLFAPPSLLNALRREWAAKAAVPKPRPAPPPPEGPAPRAERPPAEAAWSVKVSVLQPPRLLGGEMPREVIVALTEDAPGEALAAWLGAVPRERLRLALPVAMRDADLGPLAARVGALADRGLRRFECADLSSWQLLRDVQPACDAFEVSADWTWYAANAEAVRLQRACGLAFGVTGPEANLPNLLTLPDSPPREVLVAAYAPLFIAETPPLLPHPEGARLRDRGGEPLRVARLGRRWVTFSERPWSAAAHLPALSRAGFGRLRVDLSWAGAEAPCATWRDLLAAAGPLTAHFGEPRL